MEVMTPEHPKWNEFTLMLDGPEGVNRQGDTWHCRNDLSGARAILESMGGFDLDASLQYFNDNGAACDCEILLNIDATSGESDAVENIIDWHERRGLEARPLTQADIEPGGILNPHPDSPQQKSEESKRLRDFHQRPAMYSDLEPDGRLSFEDGLLDDDDKGEIPI